MLVYQRVSLGYLSLLVHQVMRHPFPGPGLGIRIIGEVDSLWGSLMVHPLHFWWLTLDFSSLTHVNTLFWMVNPPIFEGETQICWTFDVHHLIVDALSQLWRRNWQGLLGTQGTPGHPCSEVTKESADTLSLADDIYIEETWPVLLEKPVVGNMLRTSRSVGCSVF